MPSEDKYQEITKELYSKNVELVNANKTLELIQKLYQIMITSYTVESVAQGFIDLVTQTLGFTDGIVTTKDPKDESALHIIGLTNSQTNTTLLEVANVGSSLVRIPLSFTKNALVRVFQSGKAETVGNISEIWTPFIKVDDLAGITSVVGPQIILVYPIIFGEKILGSFALFHGESLSELTEFEKSSLSKIVTVFGIAIDRVTINLQLQEAQQRELEHAKELLRLKDEFVFIATHDLKTPVTAISGFVDLIGMSDQALPPDTKDSFEAIKDASERLKKLTNDLLQVARSESGTIKVEVEKLDISTVFTKAIQEVSLPAQKKAIEIKLDLSPDTNLVLADKAKLYEIVENLLSNAIKYNRQGGEVVITSQVKDGLFEFSIKDSGVGIPKEVQDKVFQKFFRARQKGTEDVTGTGLGLFVVKMLVEKMGGNINFTSEAEKGTIFTFTLPKA